MATMTQEELLKEQAELLRMLGMFCQTCTSCDGFTLILILLQIIMTVWINLVKP